MSLDAKHLVTDAAGLLHGPGDQPGAPDTVMIYRLPSQPGLHLPLPKFGPAQYNVATWCKQIGRDLLDN